MQQGAYGQYIIKNQQLNSVFNIYERVLQEYQYNVKEKKWDGKVWRHKAIWGKKGKAFIISNFVPFGEMTEEGNRYGIESEIYQNGQDVIISLVVLPYMSIFDDPDSFYLSQTIVEKVLDDERCRERLGAILARLAAYRLEMYSYRI